MIHKLNEAQMLALGQLGQRYESVRINGRIDIAVCIRDGECFTLCLNRDGGTTLLRKVAVVR